MICFVSFEGISVRDFILWKWLWEDIDKADYLRTTLACINHTPTMAATARLVPAQWQKSKDLEGSWKELKICLPQIPPRRAAVVWLVLSSVKLSTLTLRKGKRDPQLVSFTFVHVKIHSSKTSF